MFASPQFHKDDSQLARNPTCQLSHGLGVEFIWVRNPFEIALPNILGTHERAGSPSLAWPLRQREGIQWLTSHRSAQGCAATPLPFHFSAPWDGLGLVPEEQFAFTTSCTFKHMNLSTLWQIPFSLISFLSDRHRFQWMRPFDIGRKHLILSL